jgi:RNA 2',3'-cyclic 3'-phosphodiesterase
VAAEIPRGVRAFVAVPVAAPAVLERLVEIERALDLGRGVKWVAPAQKHFTLKFLGDVPLARIDAARAAVARAAAGAARFAVTLEGVGAYPPRGPARVLWADCRAGEGREALAALAHTVEAESVAAGFAPEERPFSPHLTLGRVRDERTGRAAAALLAPGSHAALSIGEIDVGAIVLFQSLLSPSGASYAPLGRFSLREP